MMPNLEGEGRETLGVIPSKKVGGPLGGCVTCGFSTTDSDFIIDVFNIINPCNFVIF